MATSLSAFLRLNELSDEEVEEDNLLTEGWCIALSHPYRAFHCIAMNGLMSTALKSTCLKECDAQCCLPFIEERDEYDDEFDRMREENLKTRVVQAQEELKDANKRVDDCRTKLGHAKAQVSSYRLEQRQ